MSKKKIAYMCDNCGYESAKWNGKCPVCGSWNSFVEFKTAKNEKGRSWLNKEIQDPVTFEKIDLEEKRRCRLSNKEVDNVFGGGVVPGSLVLIGGEPGIGKSTFMLQLADDYCKRYGKILYASGEESLGQIKLRAKRLGCTSKEIFLLAETQLEIIFQGVEKLGVDLLIIDSIQTMYTDDVDAPLGSLAQIKACTSALMRFAKEQDVAVLLTGHVTKEGSIAGPKILEHMVDAVLYFEGDHHHVFRILRAVKNRFGSVDEIAIFEMKDTGLMAVEDPGKIFLQENIGQGNGSVLVSTLQGNRVLMLEIQALTTTSHFANPRRLTQGIENNRISMIIAVLEKYTKSNLSKQDIFVNVVGGMKIDDPATDLAVAAAIYSSIKNERFSPKVMILGELGLSGEIRRISQLEKRVAEGERLGCEAIIVPRVNCFSGKKKKSAGIDLIPVDSLVEALNILHSYKLS